MEFFGLVGYVVICIMTGVIASNKGRTGFGWFVFSIFFPVIGLIIVLCLCRKNNSRNQTVIIGDREMEKNGWYRFNDYEDGELRTTKSKT